MNKIFWTPLDDIGSHGGAISWSNLDDNGPANKIPIQYVAVFDNKKIKGVVYFTEELENKRIRIDVKVSGLRKNSLHGFHVHETGDLTEKCESLCAHFNPFNKKHGGIDSKERHVGDLGNLKTDSYGNAFYSFYDNVIKLRGNKANILGRGLIIHEDEDDCGFGNNEASHINGNAGKRIACAIIGYSKNNYSC